MSSKISKLEINIKDSSSPRFLETPENTKSSRININREETNDYELDNLIFDKSNEEDEEIKNLQKINFVI